jgi:hypothetical protein
MTGLLFLFLTASLPPQQAGHDQSNPLYQLLRQEGIRISEKVQSPLPAPLMADGLDGKAQIAVIKKLIGEDIEYDRFVEDSPTAPPLQSKLGEIKGGDPKAPARALNFYFVAYGPLSKLTDKEVLERVATNERNRGKGQTLTADDLKKRNILLAPEAEKYEAFGYGLHTLLDKVEIRATGHSCWSETPESILVASQIDNRFANDQQFPNQWRSLTKDGEGDVKLGPPHPYSGAGYYLKVTQLKDPSLKGALFCETHVIFTEPFGWFEGTNLLTAKLPTATRTMVSKLRRELKK